MKNRLLILPLLLIVYLSFTRCENNNEEHLYGDNCDTLNMTYSKIKYIFEDNCYSCHTVPQGANNIKLNSYTDVKDAVHKKRLEGAINRWPNYMPMPNGQPKLDDCPIDKIEAWIHAGMPEQ